MTDLRCLILGRHAYKTDLRSYRIRKRTHGLWEVRQTCKRCGVQRLIEGPAAEVAVGMRSR